jgi:hypothetical protein
MAWIITFSRPPGVATNVFACGFQVGIDPIPVAAPLPNVAGHVEQAVAIGREGAHGRSAYKSTYAISLCDVYGTLGPYRAARSTE